MASRVQLGVIAGAIAVALAFPACSPHDTGGGIDTGTTAATGPTAPPISAAFVNNPTACGLLPVSDVNDIIHPPSPLKTDSTWQDAGIFGAHGKCKEITADNQHGVTLDLYRFPDRPGATNAFKTFSSGADLVVTGLGDQAMRSFNDLFIISGSDVVKLTYLEPFDANMQSDSHQALVGKILIPLGKLALQGVAALKPFSPTTTTSTTVRHTTTTRKR